MNKHKPIIIDIENISFENGKEEGADQERKRILKEFIKLPNKVMSDFITGKVSVEINIKNEDIKRIFKVTDKELKKEVSNE